MKIYISGGVKNGKSSYAEKFAKELSLKDKTTLYYIATMIPHDDEDMARIRRHVESRDGEGFITIEQGKDVFKAAIDKDGTYLLDSVTALLSNEMFDGGSVNMDAAEKVREDLLRLCGSVRNIVMVSDFIFSDAGSYDDLTKEYMKGLASVDKAMAKICDEVYEVSIAQIMRYK